MRPPVLALLAALPASSLLAQQPTDTTRRDTLRLAEIRVVGAPRAMSVIPGSVELIDAASLRLWHAHTVNEPLRRVSGLVVRDEEGLGLRPNIGVRGLNPTRSSKVLLLEDGIPVTFAPYGDNASYYHPPMDRFERIEVLKGSGQILFGPQTVGGVINYITPAIPLRPSGSLALEAGPGGAISAQATAGTTVGRAGFLGSAERKEAEGSRAATSTRLDDVTLKSTLVLSPAQLLTVRLNGYRERSNVTYSGLTESEWAADPRQNPFVHDSMFLDRAAASLTHRVDVSPRVALTTSAYINHVRRHWWRQSSSSAERPNDAGDAACGGMANLATSCGNQGRLRAYDVAGFEPRLHAGFRIGRIIGVTDAGFRLHAERQERRQENGATPLARDGELREDNLRRLTAVAAFVQNRFVAGRWSLTPGVRLEHVRYERVNRLADPDVSGRARLTQLVPGIGATFEAGSALTLFAGVHRGFAPPRTEDVIDNGTGGVVELDAELSWNAELGVRAAPLARLAFQGTLFRMDFENQIVAASVAGGTGAALTNGGRTLQQGAELSGRFDLTRALYLQAAFTWLPTARFEGSRFVYVGTGGGDVTGKVYAAQNSGGTRAQTSVTGLRLPYAPRTTLSATAGYSRPAFDARVELVVVGRQFGDALNTTVITPDGQQGPLAAHAIWNAAATYRLPSGTSLYASVQNVFDKLYVADRTRGLLPGPQRRMQMGIRHDF